MPFLSDRFLMKISRRCLTRSWDDVSFSPLNVVFVRLEVCHEVRRIIPRAKGIAVMSDLRNAVEISPDDCYRVLFGLHLQSLRPSFDRHLQLVNFHRTASACYLLSLSSFPGIAENTGVRRQYVTPNG